MKLNTDDIIWLKMLYLLYGKSEFSYDIAEVKREMYDKVQYGFINFYNGGYISGDWDQAKLTPKTIKLLEKN